MGFIPGVSGFVFPLDLVFLKMNNAPKKKVPIAAPLDSRPQIHTL